METWIKFLIAIGSCLVFYLLYKYRKKIAEFIEDDDYEDELEELKDDIPNSKENKEENKL